MDPLRGEGPRYVEVARIDATRSVISGEHNVANRSHKDDSQAEIEAGTEEQDENRQQRRNGRDDEHTDPGMNQCIGKAYTSHHGSKGHSDEAREAESNQHLTERLRELYEHLPFHEKLNVREDNK